MKKLARIICASITLITLAVLSGCSQTTGGGNGDGSPFSNNYTAPTLPTGSGSDAYIAGHSFTYAIQGKSIKVDFLKDGTFKEFDPSGNEMVVMAQGRYSYNEDEKFIYMVYDKIANSEGKLCDPSEALSADEIKKSIQNDNDEFTNTMLSISAYIWASSLTPSQLELYGLTSTSSKDEILSAYIGVLTENARAEILALVLSVYCIKVETTSESSNIGTFSICHTKDTKLSDLFTYTGTNGYFYNFTFTKSYYNDQPVYPNSYIQTPEGSFDILAITSSEIKVSQNSTEKTLPYVTHWNDGAITIDITFDGTSYSYEEKLDSSSYTRSSL